MRTGAAASKHAAWSSHQNSVYRCGHRMLRSLFHFGLLGFERLGNPSCFHSSDVWGLDATASCRNVCKAEAPTIGHASAVLSQVRTWHWEGSRGRRELLAVLVGLEIAEKITLQNPARTVCFRTATAKVSPNKLKLRQPEP